MPGTIRDIDDENNEDGSAVGSVTEYGSSITESGLTGVDVDVDSSTCGCRGGACRPAFLGCCLTLLFSCFL
jgi:hypothetical protein